MSLKEQIMLHEEWLDYHLANYRKARENAASRSEESNLENAARHAAIATDLRGRIGGPKP